MRLRLALVTVVPTIVRSACLDDGDITTAVAAYLDGDATTYGEIATWDVSCVTDM